MEKIRPFRYWYYFRQGYTLYFSFILAAINMLVVTYYLAIERAPFLKEVFPSFPNYAIILVAIGIPILIFTGFIHYKKMPAFKSEQEVSVESNPYIYKVPPGFQRFVTMPQALLVNKILLRLAKSEKIISDKEIMEMENIQKNIDVLLQGGYVGLPKGKLPFKNTEISQDSSEKIDK